MKAKTIKSILSKKFNEFTSSIEDKEVRELVEKNSIITGGAIASMLLNDMPNDYDIYFTNKETCKAVADYYVAKFLKNWKAKHKNGRDIKCEVREKEDRVTIFVKSAGIASEDDEDNYEYFEMYGADPFAEDATEYVERAMEVLEEEESNDDYRPVFLTTNAISLSGKVQLILRFYGEADVIHENYDFAHCTSYWTSKDKKLVLRPEAMEALLAKELVYIGSKYPICSIFRLRKFLRREFSVTAGTLLKIMWQVNELDLQNIDVLEDQLTGVDVAYFQEVIEKLRKKGVDKVDSTYLFEILDRMF